MANETDLSPMADLQPFLDSGYLVDPEYLKGHVYLTLPDMEKEKVIWRFYPEFGIYRHDGNKAYTAAALTWEIFEIREVVQTEEEWLYTGKINQFEFIDAPLKQILNILRPNAQIVQFAAKFSPLFMIYLETRIHKLHDLPFFYQSKQFGFTDQWHLPDTERIRAHPGIQSKIRDSLALMLARPFTEELAIAAFRSQYAATTIEYKDLIFAWGIMQAFLFPLKPKTDLIPFLFLCGPGDAGITRIGKDITAKWFDHLPKDDSGMKIECINGGITVPNIKEYLASINLGFLFDDLSQNWGDDIQTLFKNYLTTNSAWNLKDKESIERTSIIYRASPFFTGNVVPELFNDPQMLLRGIILYIKEKATQDQAVVYREKLAEIPDGCIGWFIIKKSRGWTRDILERLYNTMPVFFADETKQETRARANTIYKLFMLGKALIKTWFDIDLDLSKLASCIQDTKMAGVEDLHTAVCAMIHYGDIEDNQNLKTVYGVTNNTGDREVEKVVFDPQEKWITCPVFHHEKRGKENTTIKGILLTMGNLHDLKRYLKNYPALSLRQLATSLQAHFPRLEFIDYTIKKKDPLNECSKPLLFKTAVFIPEEDLPKQTEGD